MRKIKMYFIVSIDGFACGRNGEMDWLAEADIPRGVGSGISDFFGDVGTIVFTRAYYSALFACDLAYPFLKRPCIVVKHPGEGKISGGGDMEYISCANGYCDALERVREVRDTEGKDIWVAGGTELINAFFDAGLVDEVIITVIPVSLGQGKRLLPADFSDRNWKTVKTADFGDGFKQVHYRNSHLSSHSDVN